MRLNDLGPAARSRSNRKRLGRGAGSGFGKTAGRGTKGQNARSGGGVRLGFEGGQLPIQQRLPKFGFRSAKALTTAEVRLSELGKLEEGATINLTSLRGAGLISASVRRVRIIKSGSVERAFEVDDEAVTLTKGAREALEAAGKPTRRKTKKTAEADEAGEADKV